MKALSIAIVCYHSDPALLSRTIRSVAASVAHAQQQGLVFSSTLFLVDNDPAAAALTMQAPVLAPLPRQGIRIETLAPGHNLGYGAGHNLCLPQLQSDYHLILNPDVILDESFILEGLRFLDAEEQVVCVAPHAEDEAGKPLYLCKQYPSVLDLWLRGFIPRALHKPFASRLARYRMESLYDNEEVNRNVPITSGCCMLLRTQAFRELGGFDERFFLYFEDFDLSLRLAQKGKLAYHPKLRIRHLGGFSSSKGFWHIRQFSRSGKQFFKKHGWKWV